MKTSRTFALVLAFIITALFLTAFMNTKLLNAVAAADKGFAVIELFTSEGCSSCPPADQLVAKIQKEDAAEAVYVLAYHVDYWNQYGWKDAFSNADYSRRQKDYAGYLHLSQIYTPQIVVNGKTEFVGSEEATLRNAIKTNLQKSEPTQISLSIANTGQNEASIKYNIAGADKNTALFIAVLQKNAQTKVEHGENAGHTLAHVQIVRKLQKVSLNGSSGTIKVSLPQGFNKDGWEIVGLLQNTATGVITGAARAANS